MQSVQKRLSHFTILVAITVGAQQCFETHIIPILTPLHMLQNGSDWKAATMGIFGSATSKVSPPTNSTEDYEVGGDPTPIL